MKKLILTTAILIVTALVTLEFNDNQDVFPNNQSVFVVQMVDANAMSCPLCPDPDDLELTLVDCPEDYLSLKCLPAGSGCDVGSQIPCPVVEDA